MGLLKRADGVAKVVAIQAVDFTEKCVRSSRTSAPRDE
jgi:hypothetical protein